MKIRHKGAGQFIGVCPHGTCQLDHHEDQHQEASNAPQQAGEEVHHRHECKGRRARCQDCLSHFHRCKTIEYMQCADHNCCLEHCRQIEHGRLADPPAETGFHLPGITGQRIHQTERDTADPQAYGHHIRRHSMAVVGHLRNLCLFRIYRCGKHIRRLIRCVRLQDLLRSASQFL